MKIVSTLLAVALIAVGGAAIHLWREVGAGRQQIAQLQAQLRERGMPITEAVAAPAPQADISIASMASTPAADRDSKVVSPFGMAVAASDFLTRMSDLQSSPEAVAQRRDLMRSLMKSTHPDVGEALGLAPEEVERLFDLLLAQQERAGARYSLAAAGNSDIPLQDHSAALQEQQVATENELQTMLGSKYAQWQDYTQTRPAWQQRRDLRAVLEAAGSPLTEAQGKSLIVALMAEHRLVRQQSRAATSMDRPITEAMSRYSPERRQRMLDVAAPHLSPQQLEGYRGMLERAAAQDQFMSESMRRAAEAAAAMSQPGGR
jgi:hypothetical protein